MHENLPYECAIQSYTRKAFGKPRNKIDVAEANYYMPKFMKTDSDIGRDFQLERKKYLSFMKNDG